MFGPHFYYDLIRLARNKRNLYLRCGYLAALMVAWAIVYEKSQPWEGHLNDYARLASNFTHALLMFQYAVIVIVTPIYLAGTIAEEQENRTLELLFQTHLTDREILLGKFAARVVHLMFLILLALPMLAIITLWGGVNLEMLAIHFGFSLLLIVTIGSVCLFASASSSTYAGAIMSAYALEGCAAYILFPVIMIAIEEKLPMLEWWFLPIVAVPMLAIAYCFYSLALRRLCKLRDMNWIKRINPPPETARARKAPRRRRSSRGATQSPLVPGNALLWKETDYHRFHDVPAMAAWIGIGVIVFLSCVHVLFNWLEPEQVRMNGGAAPICGFLLFAMMGTLFVVHSLQTTMSVAHEHEQHTLDFLLLLPVERRTILLTKWLAPWVRNRTLVLAVLATPLICGFFGVFPFRTALGLVFLPWPLFLFVSTLSLLLSVVCRRVWRANLWLIGILVFLFLGHLLFWDDFQLLTRAYAGMLIDNREWTSMPEIWRPRAIALVVGQQSFFVCGAVLCLWAAWWQFERRTSEPRTLAG